MNKDNKYVIKITYEDGSVWYFCEGFYANYTQKIENATIFSDKHCCIHGFVIGQDGTVKVEKESVEAEK